MSAKIRTYLQDRTPDFLRENPGQRWRCDIFPADGSDHHGVGATEGAAILNAAAHYAVWQHRNAGKEPAPEDKEPRPHIGQVMAECDCTRADCFCEGRCMAAGEGANG